MRRSSIATLAVVAVLALSMLSPAAADGGPEITSPTAGEVIYTNTLNLEASDPNVAGDDTEVHWAVVTDQPGGAECTGDIHFNRNNHLYDWDNGEFSAEVDISGLAAGEYCFVFNTELDNPEGDRLVQWFYVVDDYAKVGGNVGQGRDQVYVFDGVFGDAGGESVGSLTIHYRELGESCTFTPGTFELFTFVPGDGARVLGADGVCTDSSTTSDAQILMLDKDSDPARPRGGVIVRWHGSASQLSDFDLDNTPGDTGPASWVDLERGNVVVGTR